MHTQGIDEDGTIWFFSEKDSPKNHDIEGNPYVHLVYANNSSYEYLDIEVMKKAVGALTGKSMDNGVEGELKL